MQIYDNRPIQELDVASKDLRQALMRESRVAAISAWAYVYQFTAATVAIILAAAFNHEAMRFTVPVSVMTIIAIVDSILSRMKWKAFDERNEKEKIYFEKSRAVTDANTEKILQLLGAAELAASLDPEAPPETRVIN